MRHITLVFGIAASILLPMIVASEVPDSGSTDFTEDSNTPNTDCSLNCIKIYKPVCAEPVCNGGSPYVPYSKFSNSCELRVYNCLNLKCKFKEVADKTRCYFTEDQPVA
ncbi:hypothetical protein BGZ70_001495 [Mortierella alpina]|uniref:Kazal-like domain-containing protein n=1 Tax=Mortierella alpina TaxID=64518 RepID=A0A9P6IVV0_MORAP|nr:hypothetical protein BGZ70_001495 [Mortierella alpina]